MATPKNSSIPIPKSNDIIFSIGQLFPMKSEYPKNLTARERKLYRDGWAHSMLANDRLKHEETTCTKDEDFLGAMGVRW
jgi:hypothetical protein